MQRDLAGWCNQTIVLHWPSSTALADAVSYLCGLIATHVIRIKNFGGYINYCLLYQRAHQLLL
jgi:hypothetical protein